MEGYDGYTQIPQDDDVFESKASEDMRKQQFISNRISQRARDTQTFTEGAGCLQLWWEGYFTIMPEECVFVDFWDSIVIICLAITALYMPVEAAFLRPGGEEYPALMLMSHIVDFVFTADIIFTFNVAYVETNTTVVTNIDMWVRTPRQIAAKYMAFPCSQGMTAGWFWPDVITVLPWDRLTKGHANSRDVRLVRVLRLIRMFRLVRVIKLFKRAHTQSGFSFSSVRIATCFAITLLLIHWLACVWGHLGIYDEMYTNEVRTTWLEKHLAETGQTEEDISMIQVYKTAAYFITVVLTTVGFGDLAPANQTEIITMVFTIFVTGITWAYVMGTVVNVLSSFDKFGSHFNSTMDDINELMHEQKLPKSLRYRIRRHVHESFNVQRRLHHKPALQWLSDGLKGELAIEAGVDKVCHCIWYLRDLPQPVLTELADKFGGHLFSPNELIMNQSSLFVVVRGTCIKRAKMFGRDSVFGEDMILATEMLRDTAIPRTISFVEVMSLCKESLAETCLKFPAFDRRIRKAQIRLAVWRAFIRQAEIYKREKERLEGNGRRSLWDDGYFTTGAELIDSPQHLGWMGRTVSPQQAPSSPGRGFLNSKKRVENGRPGSPLTRNGAPGPLGKAPATQWRSVGSVGSMASLGSIGSQPQAPSQTVMGCWTTSGSLQETSKSVMAELRRMHNLMKEVQTENRTKWEEFETRFSNVEAKVNALGKSGINRKFWG